MSPVFDTFGALPDPVILKTWFKPFAVFNGYTHLFGKALGLRPEDLPGDRDGRVERILERAQAMFMDRSAYLAALDELQVERVVVWVHVDDAEDPVVLEHLAEIDKESPGRFLPLPSYDLSRSDPDSLPAIIERDIEAFGIAGVCLLPILTIRRANNINNDGLFKICQKRNLPVWIHTVNTWSERHDFDFCHPRYADKVAEAFPNLKIILGHGGWPWVLEAVTVAWRHPNVYLEPSAFRWKYLATPGAGWEPLLHYGNTTIRHKVLFGSAWPLLGLPLGQVLDEVRALPLSEATQDLWLYQNPSRVYTRS